MWGFEQYGITPDILLLGKALGGGLPLGAFIASASLMEKLTSDPVLGHITTFGGHPLSCAAGLASLKVIIGEDLVSGVKMKEELFLKTLKHRRIKAVRSAGLLIAVEFDSFEENKKIIDLCIEKGVFTDWFLFSPQCMRIAPPLNISEKEIIDACAVIMECCGSA
jgi:acetylornithine/succinyldiaminopimelate/putrescine aminotransferase